MCRACIIFLGATAVLQLANHHGACCRCIVGCCRQGGANVELIGGTGFQGAQPQSRVQSTPNPMLEGGATPMGTPGSAALLLTTFTLPCRPVCLS